MTLFKWIHSFHDSIMADDVQSGLDVVLKAPWLDGLFGLDFKCQTFPSFGGWQPLEVENNDALPIHGTPPIITLFGHQSPHSIEIQLFANGHVPMHLAMYNERVNIQQLLSVRLENY